MVDVAKTAKGKRVNCGSWFKDMVHHEEKSKRPESEAAGHLASLVKDAERYILALHLAFFVLFSSSLQPMLMPVFRICLPSQVSLP